MLIHLLGCSVNEHKLKVVNLFVSLYVSYTLPSYILDQINWSVISNVNGLSIIEVVGISSVDLDPEL